MSTANGEYQAADYADGVTISDGSSHPLSEKYATLSAAQAVFPDATALTQSIAWHAINKAIKAVAATSGGVVVLPAGKCRMTPCPGPLKIPLAVDGAAASQDTLNSLTNVQVHLRGAGDRISILQWDQEVPGGYALMCGQQAGDPVNQQADSRYGSSGASTGEFANFWMIGPARALLSGNNTAGQTGCTTHGICWAARRRMSHVRVTWFNRGVDLVGDHTDFSGCQFTHNYDGLYINHPSPTLYGDWTWSGKMQSRLNRRTCVAVEYTARLGPVQFTGRPFMGTSPYAFYKVAPPATPVTGYTATSSFLEKVEMNSLFVEGLGNAVFWDGKADDGTTAPTAVLSNCNLTNFTISSFSDTYKIAGKDRCIANIGDMYGVDMTFNVVDVWTGLTLPAWNLQNCSGRVTLSGNIEGWLSSTIGAGKQPIALPSSTAANARNFQLENDGGSNSVGPWKGSFQCAPAGTAFSAGAALGFGPGGVYIISSTSVTRPFAGLARTAPFPQSPPVTSPACFVAVAQESPGGVPYNGGGTFTANTAKKLQTGGALTDVSDVVTETRIVGFASSTTRTSIFAGAIGR